MSRRRPDVQRNVGERVRDRSPGWITSLGALVALVLAGIDLASDYGANREAIHRLTDSQRELKSDVRRELDLACACCTTVATRGVR